MTKLIDSLFNHTGSRPVLHWELEGVMILLLAILGVYFLLEHRKVITLQLRNKLVLWSILVYGIYILVLLLVLGGLCVWEQYAKT
jgi:hypothetical protein